MKKTPTVDNAAPSDDKKRSDQRKQSLVTIKKVPLDKVAWTAASAFPCG